MGGGYIDGRPTWVDAAGWVDWLIAERLFVDQPQAGDVRSAVHQDPDLVRSVYRWRHETPSGRIQLQAADRWLVRLGRTLAELPDELIIPGFNLREHRRAKRLERS